VMRLQTGSLAIAPGLFVSIWLLRDGWVIMSLMAWRLVRTFSLTEVQNETLQG
jgi:hypothetical protein